MTHTGHGAGFYQLRVAGLLAQHWSPWFGGLTVTYEEDGSTRLTGAVADQAELHGLLAKIRDVGLTLISVALIEPPRSTVPHRETSDQHEDVEHPSTSSVHR